MVSFRVGLIGGSLLAFSSICIPYLLYNGDTPLRLPVFESRDVQIRDAEGALERFAAGLRYKTVSNSNLSNHAESEDAFRGLHTHLMAAFPSVHRELQLKKVIQFSALDSIVSLMNRT